MQTATANENFDITWKDALEQAGFTKVIVNAKGKITATTQSLPEDATQASVTEAVAGAFADIGMTSGFQAAECGRANRDMDPVEQKGSWTLSARENEKVVHLAGGYLGKDSTDFAIGDLS